MRLARLSSALLSCKGQAEPVGGAYDGTSLAPIAPLVQPGPQGRGAAAVFGRKGLAEAAPRPGPAVPRHVPARGRNEPVQLTLRLDPERHRRLKIVAARTGRASCDLIREALDRHLPDACPDCVCLRGEPCGTDG
jgi:hypothetical protein